MMGRSRPHSATATKAATQKNKETPVFQQVDPAQLREVEQTNQPTEARYAEEGKTAQRVQTTGEGDRLPDLEEVEQVVPVEEATDALAEDVCQKSAQ